MKHIFTILLVLLVFSCSTDKAIKAPKLSELPFMWENASVYFLLTDRFNNGDLSNDTPLNRKQDGGKLRSFMGGDIKGITRKIEEGYFDKLGINAIWLTPPIEQIHGSTDEGWGKTYAYHGYWARDWTSLDPNYGTMAEYKEMVDIAHEHGIRILMDVVLNHTGPVTDIDSQWPDDWVITSPQCTYEGYESTVSCTLVENLPDIRTNSNNAVELPGFLADKWKNEERMDKELEELNAFFERTGYPRAPKYYIIKWLIDYVRELGIDGFRVDTAKHLEADILAELYQEALIALKEWKAINHDKKIDDLDFYMVGEVYGYGIQGKLDYNYGDSVVNFFDHGFKAMINFSFKSDAAKSYEDIYSEYSEILNSDLSGFSVMNYISSHDDDGPYDVNREKVFEAGTKLLLSPGAVQIYYGDEIARPLTVEGTKGDAHLRSYMNWDELEEDAERSGYKISEVLSHWQKLGQFRKAHPAVGAGIHKMISKQPYIFTRTLESQGLTDQVLVAIGKLKGPLKVSQVFSDGQQLKDYYSGSEYTVKNGSIDVSLNEELILLGI